MFVQRFPTSISQSLPPPRPPSCKLLITYVHPPPPPPRERPSDDGTHIFRVSWRNSPLPELHGLVLCTMATRMRHQISIVPCSLIVDHFFPHVFFPICRCLALSVFASLSHSILLSRSLWPIAAFRPRSRALSLSLPPRTNIVNISDKKHRRRKATTKRSIYIY